MFCMNAKLTVLAILLMVIPQGLWAQMHHHHGEESSLELNEGKKWKGDQALQKRMLEIRNAAQEKMHDFHKDKMDSVAYEGLANQVNQSIQAMFKECKLSQKADAVLHQILAGMLNAVADMKSKDAEKRSEAYLQLIKGIGQYEEYFDHPGWKSIEH